MTEIVLQRLNDLRTGAVKLASVWTLILLIPLAIALVDNEQFESVILIAIAALAGTLPYIAVAVLAIAWLKATGAEALVAKAFEGRESRMVVLAAVLGGLAPFCSCEVIPFIAGLLAAGAPLSAVMAFWLSSPLIDPPTVLITAGALGWKFAIGKAVAAVALGLMGGFGVRFMMRKGAFKNPLRLREEGGCGGCTPSSIDDTPVWRFWNEGERVSRFRSEAIINARFLIKWLMFAYLLEALLIIYVPAGAIGAIVGGEGFFPILIGALVGAPAYLNGYAAPALVAGLMEQGMSSGSAMAFIVAGSVSSIPAMAAVWSLVNRSVFVTYMVFGIGGAVLAGVVFATIT